MGASKALADSELFPTNPIFSATLSFISIVNTHFVAGSMTMSCGSVRPVLNRVVR